MPDSYPKPHCSFWQTCFPQIRLKPHHFIKIVVELVTMPDIIPDSEIKSLLEEDKPLPDNWRVTIKLRRKRGHYERQLNVTGEDGTKFHLIVRKSMRNEFDFSVILAAQLPNSNRIFRLRRYNGLSHEHTNRIEHEVFYDFHIHYATQRYQELGMNEDSYAARTDRYENYGGLSAAQSKMGIS